MNPNEIDENGIARSNPPRTARTEAARSVDAEAALSPEAIAAADIARGSRGESLDVDRPTRGVDWVRASDLLSRATGNISRRGIDLESKLGFSLRHGIAVGVGHVGRKTAAVARKLSPLSAFGRDEQMVEPRGLGRP